MLITSIVCFVVYTSAFMEQVMDLQPLAKANVFTCFSKIRISLRRLPFFLELNKDSLARARASQKGSLMRFLMV